MKISTFRKKLKFLLLENDFLMEYIPIIVCNHGLQLNLHKYKISLIFYLEM